MVVLLNQTLGALQDVGLMTKMRIMFALTLHVITYLIKMDAHAMIVHNVKLIALIIYATIVFQDGLFLL